MANLKSFLPALLFVLFTPGCHTAPPKVAVTEASALHFETVQLANGEAPITLNLAYRDGTVARHPVILMLGSLQSSALPPWSTNLVAEGYMLAAFTAAYPPDPDPARRPQWLFFDQRFAHSYASGGHHAVNDTRVVIDYLVKRGDVPRDKIGWLGSSSTGIPGLSVVTQGPRLAAIVAFVSTGAYRQWFETWHANGLWRGATNGLWRETEDLLRQYDPILHASNSFPTAVLMVNGGADKVVDPETARAFADAARPTYQSDPDRLRLVIYDGFGHNLPADVVQMHAEHWFHLYMNPTRPPPGSLAPPTNLQESVTRSQINAADHREIIGASDHAAPEQHLNPITTDRNKSTRQMQYARDQAATIYKDKRRPLLERQAAFDALLETFTSGTRAEVIRDYIDGETVTSRILPPEDGDVFQISFDAPDGSRRWITLVGDNVE